MIRRPEARRRHLAGVVPGHERVQRLQAGPGEDVVDGVGELRVRVGEPGGRVTAALHRAVVLEARLLQHLEGERVAGIVAQLRPPDVVALGRAGVEVADEDDLLVGLQRSRHELLRLRFADLGIAERLEVRDYTDKRNADAKISRIRKWQEDGFAGI